MFAHFDIGILRVYVCSASFDLVSIGLVWKEGLVQKEMAYIFISL